MRALWKVPYCFCLLKLLQLTGCIELVKFENNLADCLHQLVCNEDTNYQRTLRLSVETESQKEIELYFGDTVDRFLAIKPKNNFTVELRMKSEKASPYAVHTRILLVDSFRTFRYLVLRQRSHTYDVTGIYQFYYVILPLENAQNGNLLKTLQKMMDFCLDNFIVHINILVEDESGLVSIYTYYPFKEDKCRDTTVMVYNRFSDGKFQWKKPTFPLKVDNFWRCPLVAVFSDEAPFVVVEGYKVKGFDKMFLEDLAASLNFTFVIFKSEEDTGKIYPNGTLTGAFKLMNDGVGDLMLGGSVCTQERKELFAETTDYFSTYLRIILTIPKELTSLEILLFPFDFSTWCGLFVVFSGKWIALAFLKKTSLNDKRKGKNSFRIHVVSWLFSILILRSSYESSIFRFLHSRPRRLMPQDLEEAIAAGYTFVARSSYLTVLNPFAEHLPIKLLFVDVSFLEIFDEFDKLDEKFALITLGSDLVEHKNDPTRYQRYITIKKPILYNIICVYMQRFSYLTEVFNKRIKQMTDHGHILRIYSRVVWDNLRKKESNASPKEKRISMDQIMGAFQMLFLLTFIAVGLLGMERMSVRNPTIKKFMDFFH